MRTSAPRKRRSPIGFESGWKRRTHFLTGLTYGSNRRNSRKNSPPWMRNERNRQCGARKRRARTSAIFPGCAGAGSRRRCEGGGSRASGNREPRTGKRKRSGGDLGGGVPGVGGQRFLRGGFLQPRGPRAGILQSTGNFVSRSGGTLLGPSAAFPRAIAAALRAIWGRNIWRASRRCCDGVRCGARERAFAARPGRLSSGLRALHILRCLRSEGRLGDAAERDSLGRRSDPARTPGGAAV